MNFAERFWRGIYTSSYSFTLMTQHPELLVYLGAAAPLYYLIQILFYNLPFLQFTGNELSVLLGMHSMHYSLSELANWLMNSALICTTFVYVFIINILNVALIMHATALVQHKEADANVRSSLRKTVKVLRKIFYWSVFFTIISLIFRVLALPTSNSTLFFSFYSFMAILFAAVWFLLTFFVLTAIVLNDQSIFQSIKTSITMTRLLFIEILGSQCWVALVSVLCYSPLSIIAHALSSSNSQGYTLWALIITGITVFLSYVILSAQTILKTFLFLDYFHVPQAINERQV